MKKQTYEIDKFEGSIAEASVVSATREQLINKKPYFEMAIKDHRDKKQIAFFTDGLNLINKRLNLKSVI